MAKFTAHRVTALPTSNIDENGLYFLRSGSKVTIYVRYNNNWELVGGTGDVEKVNGLTGEVEIDLDFTSGQLKVTSSGTGTPITTTSINLDTRYERLSNKVQNLTNPNSTTYPSTQAIADLDLDFFKNLSANPYIRELDLALPNDDDVFGRQANDWKTIIRKGENSEFRWVDIVDSNGFTLLTYVYSYSYLDEEDNEQWASSNKILIGTNYSGGSLGYSKTDVVAIGEGAAENSKGSNINANGYYAAAPSDGDNINAYGYYAARNSDGDNINANGHYAATSSGGDNINANGKSAAVSTAGNNINANGNSAAASAAGNNINANGYYAATSSKGDNINANGNSAASGSDGSHINAFGNDAAQNSEGDHINANGNSAAANSKGSYINAFGNDAAHYSKGSYINVFGSDSYTEEQDFDHVNIFGSNLQPTKSDQNIISGEEFLMPDSTVATVLAAGDKSLTTVETVNHIVQSSNGGGGGSGGVETENTADIELSGDGTENDKLKAELTQAMKDLIGNGDTAYGWGNHSSAGYQLVSNIRQNLSSPNATTYPSTQAVHDALLAGIPKEEKITGTRYTNTSASGVLTFDMDSYKVFDLVLTGNTDFQIQNPPTGTETKVIEGLVTGNHGLGLPSDWVPLPNNDDYIGSMVNHIVVTFIKSGYGGIFYSLQNIILNE